MRATQLKFSIGNLFTKWRNEVVEIHFDGLPQGIGPAMGAIEERIRLTPEYIALHRQLE